MNRLILLSVIILFIPACYVTTTTHYPPVVVNEDRAAPPPPPAHRPNPRYYYHYYPDAQVYFDTRRRIYFYQNHGQWRKSVRLPAHYHLDDYVSINMYTDLPYTKFHHHRNQYPGRPPEFVYHYFPGKRVYYRPDKNIYFYYSNGRWLRGRHLPRYLRINPDDYVVIRSERRKPYLDHHRHKADYPGRRKHRRYSYQYYPENEVYYDPRRRLYYYYDNGRWLEVRRLPRRFRLDRERRVDISHDHARRPYDAHEDHRHRYRKINRVRMNNKLQRAALQYWYYPDAEVYYDDRRRLYFYQRGNSWTQSRHRPGNLRSNKRRVRLDIASSQPYDGYHEHRRQYPSRTRMRQIGRKPGAVTPAPHRQREPDDNNRRHDNWDDQAQGRGNRDDHAQGRGNRNDHAQHSGKRDNRGQGHERNRDWDDEDKSAQRDENWQRNNRTSERRPSRMENKQRHQQSAAVDSRLSPSGSPGVNRNKGQRGGKPPRAATPMYHYRYYPDAQVYFDPNRKIYFEKRGRNWKESKRVPNSIRRHRRAVEVSSASDLPYRDFDQHANRYPPKDNGKNKDHRGKGRGH